jgi:hypothetical protein
LVSGWTNCKTSRLRSKYNGTRAENRFRLSAKKTSPFTSAGASVQSTTGSRCVDISGSNAGYNMFRGSVKGTVYLLHSQYSPLLPLPCVTVYCLPTPFAIFFFTSPPCVTVCHHISTGLYLEITTYHRKVQRLTPYSQGSRDRISSRYRCKWHLVKTVKELNR